MLRAEPKLTHAHTSRGRSGYPERVKKCATAGEQSTWTAPPSTVFPLAVRVKLHSDEATSTAFPLAEAGLRVVSLNSDLEATPVLPSCAEPNAHTLRARSPRLP